VLRVRCRAPWRLLAPRRLYGAARAFGPEFAERLRAALPELVIGCGRQAALATRLLRERGRGRCRAVQLLDPRLDPRHWDAVIVPRHDRLRGSNVLVTLGSLHAIDDDWIAAQRLAFRRFGELAAPRRLVLLGGPTAAAPWDARDLAAWARPLAAARATGGSLMVCASRRTPAFAADVLRDALGSALDCAWFGDADGPNPYPGMLAWAERIVVSPDSVNLISEACATAAPVASPWPARPRSRLAAFHRAMRECGRLQTFDGDLPGASFAPLRELHGVAEAVVRMLGLRVAP